MIENKKMASINTLCCALVFAYFATSLSSAYQCYQTWNPYTTTCEATAFGCQISKTSSYRGEIIQKRCATEADPCHINATSSLWVTYCCTEPLCNVDFPAIVGPNMCYATQCTGEGCLTNAIKNGPVTVCPRTEFGCKVVTLVTQEETTTTASCSNNDFSCRNTLVGTYSSSCCHSDLCNNGEADFPNQNDDICYDFVCEEENCVNNAVTAGTAGFCPRTANGCRFTTNLIENGKKPVRYDAFCSTDVCKESAKQFNNITFVNKCCFTSRCNSGDMGTGQATSGGQCYSAVCDGKDCLDKAIKNNTAATCTMDPAYGCATNTTLDDGPTTNATCVTESKPCIALEIAESESRMVCCKTDKCNTEAYFTSGSTTIHMPNLLVMFTSSMLMMMICRVPYKRTE